MSFRPITQILVFRYVNSKLQYRPTIPALTSSTGDLKNSDSEKVDILSDTFASSFSIDNGQCPNFLRKLPDSINLSDIQFSRSMFANVLKGLKKSSPGPDDIPGKLLKQIADFIVDPLCKIFSYSLQTQSVPKMWKQAIVTPIFKKGAHSDPSNYRPISLTCVCCKIMETIIKNQLIKFLSANKLIADEQFGFLAKRSTVTQLLDCTNIWSKSLDKRQPIDVVYIDLAKAFDTVCHDKLLVKLQAYRISGFLLGWCRDFLSGWSLVVKVGNVLSKPTPATSGVSQGSVLCSGKNGLRLFAKRT